MATQSNPNAESDPVFVIQRQPNPDKGFTYYHIWVKDDRMKLSSLQLAELLADTLQSKIQVTTTGSSDLKPASGDLEAQPGAGEKGEQL